ncbi:helix-turn-helix domain-containing protein, partial [Streptomyces sp. NPDC059717]|uniref:helix-turn-helix domain-containing protein n=1 Tax=Streptomyces sp. NPDC059717 TaxID=3346922 RepID=UPI0036CF9C3D
PRPGQLPQFRHLFRGEIHTRLNDHRSLRFHEQDHETLVDRIRVYTLASLGDPLLKTEQVARQHHISVRHLHALFRGADLTFAAWVRHERLLRIRRDLLNPAFAGRSTAAIAARWGIVDPKHLSRALKHEFGETVSDLRRAQKAG